MNEVSSFQELSPEEVDQVSGGIYQILRWVLEEVGSRSLDYIYDSASSSKGGNSDMSSWQFA
jgi:hypothetical protein